MMEHTRLEKFHRSALLILASGICLGEGLGLLGLGLVGVACVLRRRELPWLELTKAPSIYWLAGWGIWFLCGLGMMLVSEEGALKPSEVFRHVTILATPAVFLTVRSLPAEFTHRAAQITLVILGLSALFGLYQWVTGTHPLAFLARADSAIASQARIPGQPESLAATGFYFHRLKMAHVLTLGIGAGICLVLARMKSRPTLIGFTGLLFACLLGTFAKAAIGATVVAGFIVLVLVADPRQRLFALTFAALGCGLLVLSGAGLFHSLEASLSIREMIWQQATEVIHDYPAGVGVGNYSSIIGRYYDYVMPAFHVRTYPHHMCLAWWAESGVAGMVAVAGGWLLTGFHGARVVILKHSSKEQRALSAALVFSLVSFWIIGLTHDVLYHPSVALMFFSTMGWILGQSADVELREIE
jgi:hypothetical protein